MSVEDANPNPATTAPALDENKIVDRLFERLTAANSQTQQAQQPQNNTVPRGAAVEIYQALKAQGMGDEFITAQLTAANRLSQDVDSKVQGAVGQVLNYNRDSAINSLVNRFIRDICKDEPRFKAAAPLIHDRFATQLNGNRERQAELKQGRVNEDACEEILTAVAEGLAKEFGWEKSATNPALPGKGGQSTQTTQAANTGSRSTESFNEHQEAFYTAHAETLMRRGKLSREDAEAKAYELAVAMPKPTLKSRN
jgi:hypothetical protein